MLIYRRVGTLKNAFDIRPPVEKVKPWLPFLPMLRWIPRIWCGKMRRVCSEAIALHRWRTGSYKAAENTVAWWRHPNRMQKIVTYCHDVSRSRFQKSFHIISHRIHVWYGFIYVFHYESLRMRFPHFPLRWLRICSFPLREHLRPFCSAIEKFLRRRARANCGKAPRFRWSIHVW